MGFFYEDFFSKWLKEILVTAILAFIVLLIAQTLIFSVTAFVSDVYIAFFIEVFIAVVAILPAFFGAWLVSRKSLESRPMLFVPATAVLIATLLLALISVVSALGAFGDEFAAEAFVLEGYEAEYGVTYAEAVTSEILITLIEILKTLFANFGLGIIGGIIWRKQLHWRGILKCKKKTV